MKDHSAALCAINGFLGNTNLESHMATHDGKLPYICNLCNKQFRCSSSLKYHEKIHRGERQFSCGCSLQFRTSTALSKHFARKHAEVKKFSCKICEKLFGVNADLRKHMKRHSAARVCSLCDVQFKRTDYLRKHMLTTHGKDQRANFEKMSRKQKEKQKKDLQKEPDVDKPAKKMYGCGTCSMMYATKEETIECFNKHKQGLDVWNDEHISHMVNIFAISSPTAWNCLPVGLRDPGLSLLTFRRKLKTHLFNRSSF